MATPSDRPIQVLFVCSGNTCRSPMAEVLLRKLLPASLRDSIRVTSAGTHAEPGGLPSAQAVLAAAKQGLDLRSHRSRRLTADLIRESDLIFGMEPHHVDAVIGLLPASRGRVHLLSGFEAAGPEGGGTSAAVPEGIPDPMGGSAEIYEECLLRILRQIERILPHLEERVVGERRS